MTPLDQLSAFLAGAGTTPQAQPQPTSVGESSSAAAASPPAQPVAPGSPAQGTPVTPTTPQHQLPQGPAQQPDAVAFQPQPVQPAQQPAAPAQPQQVDPQLVAAIVTATLQAIQPQQPAAPPQPQPQPQAMAQPQIVLPPAQQPASPPSTGTVETTQPGNDLLQTVEQQLLAKLGHLLKV